MYPHPEKTLESPGLLLESIKPQDEITITKIKKKKKKRKKIRLCICKWVWNNMQVVPNC
jgi:hypothetical protein